MRRKLAVLSLAGFLAYTGTYLFVYLGRAFRVDRPHPLEVVGLYHGDNFSRALLVGILFLIGEVFVMGLLIASRRSGRAMTVRRDLWEWLRDREELTGEPAERVAERAIHLYRSRLEGGPPPSPVATARAVGNTRE